MRAPPTSVPDQCTPKTTQEGREKVVTGHEVVDAKLAEKVKDTVAKIQQMEGRVSSLEESKEQDMLMLEKNKKPLWAMSSTRSGKLMHLVKQASWSLPLQEWSTSCGWKFARRNVKVELTRYPGFNVRKCSKCQEMEQLRDKVSCGVELAQLIEV